MLLLFLLISSLQCLLTLSLPSAYTAECERDYRSYYTCAKSMVNSQTETEWAVKTEQIQAGFTQCFIAHGCPPPEYDRDPVDALTPKMQDLITQMKAQWDATPKVVKQCLKKRMLEKLGEKINVCLTRQNVTRFSLSSIDDPRVRAVSDVQGVNGGPFGALDQVGNDKMAVRARKRFFTKLNVARSHRQCHERIRITEENETSLTNCLLSVKFEHRGNYCDNIRKPCSAKLDPECHNRGQQIHQAVCKCKKEHERFVLQKLDDLIRQSHGEVILGDVIKTLSQQDDPLVLIRTAKKCYEENGVDAPEALEFAEAVAEDQANNPDIVLKPTPMHPRIDPDTLLNLRDVLAFDAQDESECTPCQ